MKSQQELYITKCYLLHTLGSVDLCSYRFTGFRASIEGERSGICFRKLTPVVYAAPAGGALVVGAYHRRCIVDQAVVRGTVVGRARPARARLVRAALAGGALGVLALVSIF